MSFAARAAAMQQRAIGKFGDGGTAVVRRRHTLQVVGKPAASLTLAGAHSAGATSISLKGPAGAALTGSMPAGVTLTIAGDAQVYTTTSSRDCPTNPGTLAGVPVSPALLTSPADGAAVTIVRPYGEMTLARMRGASAEQDYEGSVRGRGRILHLTVLGATFTPRPGDLVIADGESLAAVNVDVIKSGALEQRYRVTLGEL